MKICVKIGVFTFGMVQLLRVILMTRWWLRKQGGIPMLFNKSVARGILKAFEFLKEND
jgi:hypothetical protein